MTKNEKFADFRENSTAYSSWYAEFRTFRIFWDISIRSKDMRNFRLPVFLTVLAYFHENYSA